MSYGRFSECESQALNSRQSGDCAREGIDSTDQIKLLKRFGRRTISDPFELLEDEAPSGMTPALQR